MAARGLGEQFCGYTYFTHITSMFDFSVLTVCKPVKLCRDSAMLSLLVSKGRTLKSEDTAVNVADSELSVQNCLYFVF